MSTMSPIEAGQESLVTQQMLSLTIGSDLNRSSDSFSSLPGTDRNKGAVAFMELVEAYLARQADTEAAVNFDNLVVQMMGVDLNCKVPTPDHIAESLNSNGWDLKQVASIWTVSTREQPQGAWSKDALESLGGKGAVARIWDRLKSDSLTGFPKRSADTLDSHSLKKQRLDRKVSSRMFCQSTTPSLVEDSDPGTPVVAKSSSDCPRKPSRKRLTARRRGKPDVKNKITWWLEKQSSSPATPSRPSCVQEERPSTPIAIPSTPEHPPTSSKKVLAGKRRRRTHKARSKPATTPTTPKTPNPSLQDSSPVLTSKKLLKKFFKSRSSSCTIFEERAATLSGCNDAELPTNAIESSLLSEDRKWNPDEDPTTEEQVERSALRQ